MVFNFFILIRMLFNFLVLIRMLFNFFLCVFFTLSCMPNDDVVTFWFQSCDNALTSTAANQCLEQLSVLLGPNIFRGRVEQYNPR